MPGDTGRYGRDMDEEVLACHGAKARYARTQYVQCVGPWGQAALRLRTYSTRWSGARSLHAPYGGAGACVSAQVLTAVIGRNEPEAAVVGPAADLAGAPAALGQGQLAAHHVQRRGRERHAHVAHHAHPRAQLTFH